MARDKLDRPLERWRRSHNPHTLLQLVKERAPEGKRKYRLLAAAFCRRAWAKFNAEQRHALEVIERYAEGEAKYNEMRLAVAGMRMEGYRMQPLLVEAARRKPEDGVGSVLFELLGGWWSMAPSNIDEADHRPNRSQWIDEAAWQAECARMCQIVRESFAPLFDPVKVHPNWRTKTALELAEAAYLHRDPADGTLESVRLAILADALQDAGCDSPALLDHLRNPGPHVRGYWALDLILGKPE
jgi:hypothetical protein